MSDDWDDHVAELSAALRSAKKKREEDDDRIWNAALDAALAVMLDEEKRLAREAVSAGHPQDKTELLAMAVAVYNVRGKVEGLRRKP